MTAHPLNDDDVETILDGYEYSQVSITMIAPVRRWIGYGVEGSDFLMAVLANDLRGAVIHADDHHLVTMRFLVRFLINIPPAQCWGSPQAVEAWILQRGLYGRIIHEKGK